MYDSNNTIHCTAVYFPCNSFIQNLPFNVINWRAVRGTSVLDTIPALFNC